MSRRFRHLQIVLCGVCVILGSGCRTLQLQQPTTLNETDWTVEGDAAGHAYHVQAGPAPPLEVAWTYNATAGFGPGSPIVVGNLVLVGNRKGEVHGIRLDTGKRVGLRRFGASIEGTPVVDGGIVYVPVAWGGRSVQAYKLSSAGTVWQTDHPPVESGLVIHNGLLYAVDVEGTVRALVSGSGMERWAADLGGGRFPASPVLVNDDALVVADDRGLINALNPSTGAVLWKRQLNAPVQVTPSSDGRKIYFATTRGRLAAIDPSDGNMVWSFEAPDTTVYLTTAAVSREQVVFGGSDGILRSLDPASGTLMWSFQIDEAFSSAPLIAGNVVYAGSMGANLYALDAETGALLWSEKLKGRVKSGMAAAGDRLVVLAEPNLVYLFKPEESYAAKP